MFQNTSAWLTYYKLANRVISRMLLILPGISLSTKAHNKAMKLLLQDKFLDLKFLSS